MAMRTFAVCLLAAAALAAPLGSWAQSRAVYRCPGNVYTSEVTEKEAKDRGCRTIEGAPITIVAPPKPRPQPGAPRAEGEGKVDAKEQRARDSDARKILEAELKREEDALAALQADFKGGEPDRLGSERNYQRYLDRVEEMRKAIERKQTDIAAIRRELAKLPAPRPE